MAAIAVPRQDVFASAFGVVEPAVLPAFLAVIAYFFFQATTLFCLGLSSAFVAIGLPVKFSVRHYLSAFARPWPTPLLRALVTTTTRVPVIALLTADIATRARPVRWMPSVFQWLSP